MINRFFSKSKLALVHFFQRKKVKKNQRSSSIALNKREKFVISVVILSFFFFISESVFANNGFLSSLILALLTNVLLFFSLRVDLKDNFFKQIFTLPFLFTLAFGLTYFLVPSRLLSRIILTTLYGVGLYSLFLSENIFVVASIRTIALLNGARIVTFVISLVSYFLLTTIIYSFHQSVFITIPIFFLCSYFFVVHSLWTYTLEKKFFANNIFALLLSLCFTELATVLWFWPTSPAITSLFLTGAFYICIGLSHVWLDRRLFRSVLFEYVWVGIFAFILLLWFTPWKG